MKQGLDSIEHNVKRNLNTIVMNRSVDTDLVKEVHPDLLVWATGAIQNIPDIHGLDEQHIMTSIEYFQDEETVKGPRVLVIGAGRAGVEIAEKLGKKGYEVVATKRTDPKGSMMEMITKKLTLKRLEQMKNVKLMPHTTVKGFTDDSVQVEQDGKTLSLEPFQTVILASGMLSAAGPDEEIKRAVSRIEIIGDARDVKDIFTAVHGGYSLAMNY